MTIARACRPPTQELCERMAGHWWTAQHPPRTVLNNDDCSGLPPASPGIMPAVGRPLVDCSAPS